MPYIITTHTYGWAMPGHGTHSATRRAVATLDEARAAAHTSANMPATPSTLDALMGVRAAIDALPESGGTVGPLPDGTVIEVEPIDWTSLQHAVGTARRVPATPAAIIDAYNAAGGPS